MVEKRVRGLLLKDLRVELRALGLNPAGGMDALRERLVDATMNPSPAQAQAAAPARYYARRALTAKLK
jgi:hypothetical protein